jgi:site-specific DNA-adenine methylase
MDTEKIDTMTRDELISFIKPIIERENQRIKKLKSEEHKEYRRNKNREYYQRRKQRMMSIS